MNTLYKVRKDYWSILQVEVISNFEVDAAVNKIRAEVDPEAELIFGNKRREYEW